MKYLFYRQDSNIDGSNRETDINSQYEVALWHPGLINIIPSRLSPNPFAVWWFFHQLGIFTNGDYSILLISDSGTLVHRSGIYPKYFRFPFMADDDLQISDTWTHGEYQNRGLATLAIKWILQLCSKPGRHFWYVVEQDNLASIRVIEKSGFIKIGEGDRTRRFGVRLFGSYILKSRDESSKG